MVTVLFSYDAFPWCASNGVAPARKTKSSKLAGNRLVIDHPSHLNSKGRGRELPQCLPSLQKQYTSTIPGLTPGQLEPHEYKRRRNTRSTDRSSSGFRRRFSPFLRVAVVREFDLEIELQAHLGKTRRHDLQRALPCAAEGVVLREDRADVQRIVQIETDGLAHAGQPQQFANAQVDLIHAIAEVRPRFDEADRDIRRTAGEWAAERLRGDRRRERIVRLDFR